jgi:hypothetical protein
VKPAKSHSGKVFSESAVILSFPVDIPTDRGGLEVEEILHGCQIRSVNPLVETVSPGAILVGDRESLLDGFLQYF